MIAGTLFGLGSAFFWSLANVSIHGSSRRFGTYGSLVWAHLVGALVAIPAAAMIEGAPGSLDSVGCLYLLVAALASALAYVGLFDALRRGRVSVVAPIVSAWSLVSVLVAVIRFGERPGILAWLGIALIVVGNLTLARTGADPDAVAPSGRRKSAGVFSALLSALGFGLMVPASSVVGESLGRIWMVPAVWGLELVIGIPVLLLLGRRCIPPRSGDDWRHAITPGLFEVVGFCSLSLGLAVAPIGLVSPTSSLSTAFSVAWGLVLLRERLHRSALVGAIAASAGVLLVNL